MIYLGPSPSNGTLNHDALLTSAVLHDVVYVNTQQAFDAVPVSYTRM